MWHVWTLSRITIVSLGSTLTAHSLEETLWMPSYHMAEGGWLMYNVHCTFSEHQDPRSLVKGQRPHTVVTYCWRGSTPSWGLPLKKKNGMHGYSIQPLSYTLVLVFWLEFAPLKTIVINVVVVLLLIIVCCFASFFWKRFAIFAVTVSLPDIFNLEKVVYPISCTYLLVILTPILILTLKLP